MAAKVRTVSRRAVRSGVFHRSTGGPAAVIAHALIRVRPEPRLGTGGATATEGDLATASGMRPGSLTGHSLLARTAPVNGPAPGLRTGPRAAGRGVLPCPPPYFLISWQEVPGSADRGRRTGRRFERGAAGLTPR
ncbi:hypothetical protein GCM10009605_01750 [Nocardiopsis composta]